MKIKSFIKIVGSLTALFLALGTNSAFAKDLWVKDNEQASLQPEALIYLPLQQYNNVQSSIELSLQESLMLEMGIAETPSNLGDASITNSENTDPTEATLDGEPVVVSLAQGTFGWKEDHLNGDDAVVACEDSIRICDDDTPKLLVAKGELAIDATQKEGILAEDYKVKITGAKNPTFNLKDGPQPSKKDLTKDKVKKNPVDKLLGNRSERQPRQTKQKPDLGSRIQTRTLPERNPILSEAVKSTQTQKPKLLK